MKTLIKVAKRVGVVLLAWTVASFTFGFIPLLLDRVSTSERIASESSGFIACGIWVFYRAFSALFHFPKPRGKMRTAIDITWAVFGYYFVGGTVVAATGHPTPAAFIVGLPAAVIILVILARERKRAELPAQGPPAQ